MQYDFALPDDADLDSFSSGDTEVDGYFSTRTWFKSGKQSPPTYQFRTDDGRVIREQNLRAIAFYCKVGFSAESAGAVQRSVGGTRHLTMRKRF